MWFLRKIFQAVHLPLENCLAKTNPSNIQELGIFVRRQVGDRWPHEVWVAEFTWNAIFTLRRDAVNARSNVSKQGHALWNEERNCWERFALYPHTGNEYLHYPPLPRHVEFGDISQKQKLGYKPQQIFAFSWWTFWQQIPGLISGRAGREGLGFGEEDSNGNVAAHSHS